MSDIELLDQHRSGCESAFADLVRRHLGWVYGVARRRLHDAHSAEDVAQGVFILLHRKAPRFAGDGAMVRWLHRAAWYATEVAARNERRRRLHETEAVMMNPRSSAESDHETDPKWRELAPLLDELIGRLSRADHEAILLRYYREMTYVQVAQEMGSTEEAARKRVDRAVEKLRRLACEKRGLSVSAAAIGMHLTNHANPPLPAGLMATTTAAATAAPTSALVAGGGAIAKGALIMMTWSKISVGAGVTAALLALGGGLYWMTQPAKPQVVQVIYASPPPRAASLVVNPANARPVFPRLSPFTAVRWQNASQQVRLAGRGDTWYELVSINDIPVERLVAFAQKTYGERWWQKRLDEDLVEVLTTMGLRPAQSVKLQLRAAGNAEIITLPNVPMTAENRRTIWEARNPTTTTQPGMRQ